MLKRVSFYILGIVTLNFFMRCNCICTLKLKLFFCSRSHSRKIQIFKNLYLFGALTYLKSQGILLWSSCLNHERGSQKANMLEGNLLKRGGWKICRFKEGLAKRKRGGGILRAAALISQCTLWNYWIYGISIKHVRYEIYFR